MAQSVREQLEALNEACKAFCLEFDGDPENAESRWDPLGPDGTPNFRLLYSSPETFGTIGGVMLLGTNPGGDSSNAKRHHPDLPFLSPTYSAYLDDCWGDSPRGEYPMQRAARAVAQTVAGNRPRGERLLRSSPAGNLIPFRSEKPTDLPQIAEEYGLEFGWQLIVLAQPRVLILLASNVPRWEWLMERIGHSPEPDSTRKIIQTLILREARLPEGRWPRFVFALPALNTSKTGQNAKVISTFRQRVEEVGRDNLLGDAGART